MLRRMKRRLRHPWAAGYYAGINTRFLSLHVWLGTYAGVTFSGRIGGTTRLSVSWMLMSGKEWPK